MKKTFGFSKVKFSLLVDFCCIFILVSNCFAISKVTLTTNIFTNSGHNRFLEHTAYLDDIPSDTNADSSRTDSADTTITEKAKVNFEMYNGDIQEVTNTISPRMKLTNTGNMSVSLKDLKIKYFYTVDGEKKQSYWCDWSNVSNSAVYASFVKMPASTADADYYVQIEFDEAAGELAPRKYHRTAYQDS